MYTNNDKGTKGILVKLAETKIFSGLKSETKLIFVIYYTDLEFGEMVVQTRHQHHPAASL